MLPDNQQGHDGLPAGQLPEPIDFYLLPLSSQNSSSFTGLCSCTRSACGFGLNSAIQEGIDCGTLLLSNRSLSFTHREPWLSLLPWLLCAARAAALPLATLIDPTVDVYSPEVTGPRRTLEPRSRKAPTAWPPSGPSPS